MRKERGEALGVEDIRLLPEVRMPLGHSRKHQDIGLFGNAITANLILIEGRLRHVFFSSQKKLWTILLAFVCSDDTCSWESREAWWPQLLRFQLVETGFLEEDSQIVHAAPPGRKARSPARSVLLMCEIGDDQAPSWFEHTSDFRESLTFEGSRQMMHHQGREHHIKRLVRERELLDHPDLEIS
jgi:hypothetical protein